MVRDREVALKVSTPSWSWISSPIIGKFGEYRVHQLVVQRRISAQCHAQDGGERQQQREGGDEAVVRQQRYEVAALVIAELLDHRDREPDDGMPLLPGVDTTCGLLDGVHTSTLAPSSVFRPGIPVNDAGPGWARYFQTAPMPHSQRLSGGTPRLVVG